MPDAPPMSLALADLVGKLRGQQPGYAQTRLGRQPIIYARDQDQYEGLTNPLHNPARVTYGATFMSPGDLGFLSRQSPLHGATQEALSTGEPTSIIAPYQKPVSGPGGSQGTEPGVPLHEATHQFTKGLPLDQLFSQLDSPTQVKMATALSKAGYERDAIPGEVASRLVSGQFGSLGLTRDEGMQARQTFLSNLQQVDQSRGQRLSIYTRGREPVNALDPQGVSRPDESRDPETGFKLP